jgi:plasmid stability protein
MPSLQVRELPENIYRLLQENAAKEHRSLAQEAVVTLAKSLKTLLLRKLLNRHWRCRMILSMSRNCIVRHSS